MALVGESQHVWFVVELMCVVLRVFNISVIKIAKEIVASRICPTFSCEALIRLECLGPVWQHPILSRWQGMLLFVCLNRACTNIRLWRHWATSDFKDTKIFASFCFPSCRVRHTVLIQGCPSSRLQPPSLRENTCAMGGTFRELGGTTSSWQDDFDCLKSVVLVALTYVPQFAYALTLRCVPRHNFL